MSKTVVGLFDDFSQAESTVRDLVNSGFTRDQISIIARDTRAGTDSDYDFTVTDPGDAAAAGAGTGAAAGTVIGGGVGLLASLGALAIPGFGPIIAAGPLIATLTGAGVGAATGALTGGLIGALTEAGVPDEEAGYYEEGVRRGGTLVTVSCEDAWAERAADIMRNHGVIDIEKRGASYRAGIGTGTTDTYSRNTADTRPMAGVGHDTPAQRTDTASSIPPSDDNTIEEEVMNDELNRQERPRGTDIY